MSNPTTELAQAIDVAIVGGGIAGAWLLRNLTDHGYSVALFERDGWGSDQTLASQGMIHGGLKYALSGALTSESEAIASMPARWRACLENQGTAPGDVGLGNVPLLSDNYVMYAEPSTLGRLTTFFASKALRGRIEKLARPDWPEGFAGFDGVVYALNDFVMDTSALLTHLVSGLESSTWQMGVDKGNVKASDQGYEITTPDGLLKARTLISCAGNGSEALMADVGVAGRGIQRRPLKQVWVRPAHNVSLWAHCLTGVKGSEPRLTITSHQDPYHDGGLVWSLGGRLSTQGIRRSDDEQIQEAERELKACVPWLDWQGAEYQTHTIDRAEPTAASGLKPDEAYAERQGDFILAFPTKLTLTPDMADRVRALLPDPQGGACPASSQPVPLGAARWSGHA